MINFFPELKRRHIYRVAAAYAVVAWILIQIVNNIAPALKLPDWALSLVLVFLVVGFPIALVFAWAHQLASATAQVKTGPFDWALLGALAVVIGIFAYQQFGLSRATVTAGQHAGVQTAREAAANPAGISLAVLPFANLSGDAGQEFFSDGMTEEITSALAKVQGLTVIGRTSAFEYKGQNRDLRAIGHALGVTHLIEGSVRKDGNRVRISAQLIRADNAAHLWAENYDRQLTDIFATQEDIAQAIAGALKVPLGLAQGETLVRNRTKDLASYDQYLRAKAFVRARGQPNILSAIAILEPLVARDTDFAPAWALLAYAYEDLPIFDQRRFGTSVEAARSLIQGSYDKAEKAARKAIILDSRYAGGYGALARVQSYRGTWASAEDLFKQALALDPDDADVLAGYGISRAQSGHIRDYLSVRERLLTLEPTNPNFKITSAASLMLDGQNAAAIQLLETVPPGVGRNVFLATTYAALGRYADSADTLLLSSTTEYPRSSVEAAARIIRSAPATTNAPESLPAVAGILNFVYAYVGALPRVMEEYERDVSIGYYGVIPGIWLPDYAPLHNSERFKKLLRDSGLVDYWKARGWPDLCRPVGADDFVCD